LEALVPLFAIFCIFIGLPWLLLHFLSRNRAAAAKAAGDPGMNASLSGLAERLERRLDAIEILLDHEVPGWRNRRTS
jgi:phage shock protein B